jgi:osmoprotectant transport system substrate-binding protein
MFTARKKRWVAAAAAIVGAAIALTGCASSNPLDTPTASGSAGGDTGTIVVGSQAYY